MRECPKCKKWTLDFDDYFGRFRCLNPECGWMPPSAAEREIRLLQSRTPPIELDAVQIPQVGLTLTPSYDAENDAFSVDFGLSEPTFDLPEPDGRMIWRIGRRGGDIAGFTIVGVRDGGISEISVELIARRKEGIERRLRRVPDVVSRGRATKGLIEEVIVTAVTDDEALPSTSPEVEGAWKEVVTRVHELTGGARR